VRAVIYNDYEGGYIDNVPSTFTRSNQDLGNFYFGITPTAGKCPNGLPAGAAGFCAPPNSGQINNYAIAKKDQNPTTYTGGRVSALYEINNDWNVLITESLQSLDAEGLSADYPVGSDFQTLKPLQVTAFTPSYDKDRYENTSWTVNGKIGDLSAVYTGAYMIRNISQQMEYTNYSRSAGGMYYQCTGGTTPLGRQALLLCARRLLARRRAQHPPEQRSAVEQPGRLAAALHRRRLRGTVPHLRRDELRI
jgi:hypothetical protein